MSSEDVCGYPGAPAHSSVRFSGPSIEDVIDEEDGPLSLRSNLAIGTVATYACERGFELLGPARRQCQEDGTWSPEGVPFCGESRRYIYRIMSFYKSIRYSWYSEIYNSRRDAPYTYTYMQLYIPPMKRVACNRREQCLPRNFLRFYSNYPRQQLLRN